jgi:hypothetical protein
MITSFTANITLFIIGIVVGIYTPLVIMYFVVFLRRANFTLSLIWQASWRIIIIAFLFLVIMAALGFAIDIFHVDPDDDSLWLFWGTVVGFLTGLSLFAIGILRGRGQVKATAD